MACTVHGAERDTALTGSGEVPQPADRWTGAARCSAIRRKEKEEKERERERERERSKAIPLAA